MAGLGTRFSQAGYTVPKFQVLAHGRSLLEWSLTSLEQFFHHPFTFVLLKNAAHSAFIRAASAALGISSVSICEIDAVTSGQAETALLGLNATPEESGPIMIYNIDTYVEPWALSPQSIRGAGWIPCFEAEGDAWSFVTFDKAMRVDQVVEKRRISPFATIGLYYFESTFLYRDAYRRYDFAGYKERFVAPLYEELLRQGHPIYTTLVAPRAMHPLGTPEQVKLFESLKT